MSMSEKAVAYSYNVLTNECAAYSSFLAADVTEAADWTLYTLHD